MSLSAHPPLQGTLRCADPALAMPVSIAQAIGLKEGGASAVQESGPSPTKLVGENPKCEKWAKGGLCCKNEFRFDKMKDTCFKGPRYALCGLIVNAHSWSRQRPTVGRPVLDKAACDPCM